MTDPASPKPEYRGPGIEEIAKRYTARFRDILADKGTSGDARVEGCQPAQYRFIGASTDAKQGEGQAIPPGSFTLSIMCVEPGQGELPHTHEVEELFFVLEGYLTVFVGEEAGRRVEVKLRPWEHISFPAGVTQGYANESVEPVYVQVMLSVHPSP